MGKACDHVQILLSKIICYVYLDCQHVYILDLDDHSSRRLLYQYSQSSLAQGEWAEEIMELIHILLGRFEQFQIKL